ncbi:MAG: hypothetical protein J7M40_10900 [Planctomycetes bacterium]|nr:hypothetical protein [Planctomycetota bacterium]
MGITRESYCSWCFEYASHELHEPRKLRRHLYQCKRCGNFTVKCRYCRNMARSLPNDWQERQASQGRFKNMKMKWNHELCAEHDGTIASFAHLSDT